MNNKIRVKSPNYLLWFYEKAGKNDDLILFEPCVVLHTRSVQNGYKKNKIKKVIINLIHVNHC